MGAVQTLCPGAAAAPGQQIASARQMARREHRPASMTKRSPATPTTAKTSARKNLNFWAARRQQEPAGSEVSRLSGLQPALERASEGGWCDPMLRESGANTSAPPQAGGARQRRNDRESEGPGRRDCAARGGRGRWSSARMSRPAASSRCLPLKRGWEETVINPLSHFRP